MSEITDGQATQVMVIDYVCAGVTLENMCHTLDALRARKKHSRTERHLKITVDQIRDFRTFLRCSARAELGIDLEKYETE